MGARGVHFALDDAMASRLLAAAGNDDDVMELIEQIEEEGEFASFETDKAWDAIHRSLTDGELGYRNGEYPLNAVILGGRQLHREDHYIVSYLTPQQVQDAATVLSGVTPETLQAGYALIDPEEYEEHGHDDLLYMVANFDGLPGFFRQAASASHHVIFTVDQ